MRTPEPQGASPRLLLVGNVVVDVVSYVPALPGRGEDVEPHESLVSAGGGFNVLAAARRLGMTSIHAGLSGTGPFADVAASAMRADGIVAPLDPVPGIDTGLIVALVEPDGERTFVTIPGAERLLTRQHLEQLPVSPGDFVYVSGYSLLGPEEAGIVSWVADLAPDVVTVFDPQAAVDTVRPASLDALMARCDWVSCSRREATILTGHEGPEEVALELAGRAAGGVVIRDGGQGCWVAENRSRAVHIPAFPAWAVDTNGAGDAHAGAFMAALAGGQRPCDAARTANAAAALAVGRRGPATAPHLEELNRFRARISSGSDQPSGADEITRDRT